MKLRTPIVPKAPLHEAIPVAGVTVALQSTRFGTEVVSEKVIVPEGKVKPVSATVEATVAVKVTG